MFVFVDNPGCGVGTFRAATDEEVEAAYFALIARRRAERQAIKATQYCVTQQEFEAAVRVFYPEADCDWSHDRGMFVVEDGMGDYLGEDTNTLRAWKDAWDNL
jgi:hypothetical protein